MAKKQEAKSEYVIKVSISDFTHGLRVYEHVSTVRIASREYSLLLMADYFPIIGQIDGSVEIMTEEELVKLEGISGFFVHRNNEFSLLIKEQREPAVPAEKAEPNGR